MFFKFAAVAMLPRKVVLLKLFCTGLFLLIILLRARIREDEGRRGLLPPAAIMFRIGPPISVSFLQ